MRLICGWQRHGLLCGQWLMSGWGGRLKGHWGQRGDDLGWNGVACAGRGLAFPCERGKGEGHGRGGEGGALEGRQDAQLGAWERECRRLPPSTTGWVRLCTIDL